jgi:Type II CAAX prenyl endopeptidase Rce1-like
MPSCKSTWYPWRVLWNVLWVVGWAAGLWGAGLFVRDGNFALALLLLLLSLGLLCGRAGISTISALTRFCFNPSTPVTKVANPLSVGCSLLGYDLFLALISTFFVGIPTLKHLGVSPIAGLAGSRLWISVLLAPVAEELTFRLPLRYTEVNLTISVLLATLFVVRRLLLKLGIFGLATRWLWSAVFALLVASVVLVLMRTEPVKRFTSRIWLGHFRSVVYTSCFAFGLFHLSNYRFSSFTAETLLLAPLLVLPQIISGFIFGFARMRLGMIWCIVLHAAMNFLAFWLFPVRPR